MALQKKLMCFNTQEGFDAQLNDGNIQDYSIVFIKDTQRIWTHGVYFSSLKEVMDALSQSGEDLEAVKTELTELINTASQTAQDEINEVKTELTDLINDVEAEIPSVEAGTNIEVTQNGTVYTVGTFGIYSSEETDTMLEQVKSETEEYTDKTVQELRDELEKLLPTMQSYCLMVRDYGGSDPEAKMFYGSQEAIQAIGGHMRMAAVRGQGDYTWLAPNRITLDENGGEVYIDGSDGDILVATDTTIYLYAEKIEAEDGALEIFGLGLTPLALFGKAAIGYEPFAFSCDSCVYTQLTSSNTDHIPVDDVREQLHCVYNENVDGYSATATTINYFKETYKPDSKGYESTNYNDLRNLLFAQAKNADEETNYPYMGLYYRFVEIWLAAVRCELGTMDGSAENLLGAYMSGTNIATESTFADEAISANCGLRIIKADGTSVLMESLFLEDFKLTSESDASYISLGIDGTKGFHCTLPMMTPQRVIDRITAAGNIGYINDASNVFDEDGNVHTDIDLNTGEGMETAKRYFVVRDCPGAQSFSDGVMTGVVNCYFKLSFADGVCTSTDEDLTGGIFIAKFSTMLYRGLAWGTGHWNFMQGFHYVLHTLEDGSRYWTTIYQRDPNKIKPYKSSMTYEGLDLDGDTDFEIGYVKCEDKLEYGSGWMKNSNPSISLFYHPDFGGDQHTHVCAYNWRDYSWGGAMNKGYRTINSSMFGGICDDESAALGTVNACCSLHNSYTQFGLMFSIVKLNIDPNYYTREEADAAIGEITKTVQELRDEIEALLPTKQSYCLMVRDYGDADPEAKMFYGSQDAIKAIGNHMRMAAIRGQGDYKLLAPNRITLSEDGEEIAIDGSDGDILVATDATIYLYAEKIEAEDGALEIFGLGLTPLTLFGKEAIGYEPFAFACDSCVYAQLTSSNTDHIPVDDVRSQLHCIYNENIAGYSATTTAFFKETYKANGNGFANGSYNTTNTILRAQAKNEDANTNYPYMGLYYRFLEIWLAALRCELGTMDGSATDLLGCGVSSSLTATTNTFADEAISANCGLRLIDSTGTTLTITNLNQSILQLTSSSDAAYVANGVDGTQAFYSSLPLMTPQRVIDRIVASGNLGYINDASNVFDEDGNVHTDIDLNTGEGMEAAKRYFVVRDCPGAESFSDGVMTGVINCYFKLSFADGVYRSNGTDLTGGTLIVKLSTMLYRGMSWATGHWNWMQGFHYVIHTLEDESRYVTAIYQRDPHKIEPWISGMTYTGLDSDGDTDWEKCGYDKCDDQLVYDAGWMKNSNPSISLFYYPDSGGAQHTYVCAYTWRNNSYSGNLNAGYRSVNASAFGGSGDGASAASGSLSGNGSVARSSTGCAPVFALLDYMTVS